MLMSTAFAQTAAAAPAEAAQTMSLIMGYVPLVLVLAIFYFMVMRPQNKRVREHQDMLAALRRGDKVVTSGGIVGEVVRLLDDDMVVLQIDDNTRVKVVKSFISSLAHKSTAADTADVTSLADHKARDTTKNVH